MTADKFQRLVARQQKLPVRRPIFGVRPVNCRTGQNAQIVQKFHFSFPDNVVGNGRDDGKRTVIRSRTPVTIGSCFSGPVMHHNAFPAGRQRLSVNNYASSESGVVRADGESLAARCARLFSQDGLSPAFVSIMLSNRSHTVSPEGRPRQTANRK